jgi:hypothetical protein
MGPWSRSFVAAVAGNAERPDLDVTDLRIEPGAITGDVEGCVATVSASPIPARTWESITRFARGMGPLEEAVAGRLQSVHLEHLLEEDWDEHLIPRRSAIWQSCSCDAETCPHRVALAYAVADEIDVRPLELLRWRGLGGAESTRDVADPWRGGEVHVSPSPRPMPKYAVLKRLGSGANAQVPDELGRVLHGAYDRLTSSSD